MIYYNEFEPFAVEWLKNLSKAGHINAGRVDSRSIREVSHGDVAGATQAHFFAGIGVWSYALRLAGWPDDRPVWTGSCPCQPFSVAGRGAGVDDERHLWPEWFRLIRECRPPVVFGEQVASPDGLAWLDAVRADLEGAGYAFGAADLCAAGVGAPHIRQRLYFVGIARDGLADAGEERRRRGADLTGRERDGADTRRPEGVGVSESRRIDGGLADTSNERLDGRRSGQARDGRDAARLESERLRDARGLADTDAAGRRELWRCGLREDSHAPHGHDADGRGSPGQRMGESISEGLEGHTGHGDALDQPGRLGTSSHGPAPTSGFWSNPDWVACRDDKQRPVEPGSFPLAHGAPQRVGRLRAYGNAIVSEVAATFIRAVMETL